MKPQKKLTVPKPLDRILTQRQCKSLTAIVCIMAKAIAAAQKEKP
jgi:hypothetical protein